MSTEVLREAAALMRERAEAASQGEWLAVSDNKRKSGIALVGIKSLRGQGETGCIAVLAGTPRAGTVAERHHNAEHIASWHPAVALKVAHLLDVEARTHERAVKNYPTADIEPDPATVAIARAYLGRDA